MNSRATPATQTKSTPGWIILSVVASLQAVAAFFLLLGNSAATFEADTGVAWAELRVPTPQSLPSSRWRNKPRS